MIQKNNILIIGGSSGLGLALAKVYKDEYRVFVTGRSSIHEKGICFIPLELSKERDIIENTDSVLASIGNVDALIIAAGFYQEGTLAQLEDDDITKMISVGLTSPILIISKLLKRQKKLNKLVIITSTSQWIPRLYEPVYTAIKGGMGMLGNSLSKDDAIEQTLVAAPAGMKTKFWQGTNKDQSEMMEADYVAGIIKKQLDEKYKYRYVRILRLPLSVEVVESR